MISKRDIDQLHVKIRSLCSCVCNVLCGTLITSVIFNLHVVHMSRILITFYVRLSLYSISVWFYNNNNNNNNNTNKVFIQWPINTDCLQELNIHEIITY